MEEIQERQITEIELGNIPVRHRPDYRTTELIDVIDRLRTHKNGCCVKIEPALSEKQVNNLRMCCRYRGFIIKTRTTPEATYGWRVANVSPFPSMEKRRPNRRPA